MWRPIAESLGLFFLPFLLFAIYLALRMRWPLAIEHWTRSRVATLVIAGLAAALARAGRRVAVRAARPGRLHPRPCRERRPRAGADRMSPLPGLRDGRLADRRLLEIGRLARALAALNGDGEETQAGRRRGARPRARRGGRRFRPRHHRACREVVMKRARAAGFGVAPTGLAHGTVTLIVEGKADRGDDAETRRRHRRAPRQGRVWPRLPRRRAAARLHHQRAVADRRRDRARLRRRARRSRRPPRPFHRRGAPAHPRGLSAHPALLPLLGPLRRRPARQGGPRRRDRRARGSGDPVAREGARRADEAFRRAARRRRARRDLRSGAASAAGRRPDRFGALRPPRGDRGGLGRARPTRCCASARSACWSRRIPSGCANGCASPTPRPSGWRSSPAVSPICTTASRRRRSARCGGCCSSAAARARSTRSPCSTPTAARRPTIGASLAPAPSSPRPRSRPCRSPAPTSSRAASAHGQRVGATLKKLQALWIRAGFPREPEALARLLDEALKP